MQTISSVNESLAQGNNSGASTELAKQTLSKVVDLFSSQDLPGIIKTAFIDVRGKPAGKWTLSNRFVMMAQGTRDARGYRQWQEVGRYVKKGAKAIYILRPKLVKKTEEKDGQVDEKQICIGFSCLPVFRYEDTDGKALEECANIPLPPLAEVALAWGYKIEFGSSAYFGYGSMSEKTNEIKLATKDPWVFFHELGHVAHSRLEKLKPGQDPEQETIAELVAVVLAEMFGFEIKGEAQKYIANSTGSKTPEQVGRQCLKVLSKVDKILTLILDEAEKIKTNQRMVITC